MGFSIYVDWMMSFSIYVDRTKMMITSDGSWPILRRKQGHHDHLHDVHCDRNVPGIAQERLPTVSALHRRAFVRAVTPGKNPGVTIR